ncbi:hypothetical protein D9M68_869760 [compost metagenome]
MKLESASARSSCETKIVNFGFLLPISTHCLAKTSRSISGEARITFSILEGTLPSRMPICLSDSIVSQVPMEWARMVMSLTFGASERVRSVSSSAVRE